MLSEERIIKGCVKNDKRSQKLLYDKYASTLLGIALRYAKSKDEAEDILQDAFCKILMKINQYEGSGSFEGWMKRILVNTAITNYKLNVKHYYHSNLNEVSDSFIKHDHFGDHEFQMNELLSVINTLPEGYKMVFNLYAIEGYKHREIAELLGIEENTSKSQFSRARKQIQASLEKLATTNEVFLKATHD